MNKNEISITIIGAGISGLATAFWLKKEGYSITVLEAGSKPGGSMISEKIGEYLVDYGPNSGLETSPKIRELVEEVGLTKEMIYANKVGDKRYILRDNKLHALPTSPQAMIKSKLFSTKGKLRLMLEPFIGKSEDGYYQSISEFVSRRLGQEFLDYAINPFVSGVFAGDPDKLSVKSAFPKLYRLEELYGGLIKGMVKGARERKKRAEQSKQNAKMFSFLNGMQSFPVAISNSLGDSVFYNSTVNSITKDDNKYNITYTNKEKEISLQSDIVLSTVPSFKFSKIFSELDSLLNKKLNDIFYPKVMLLYLGYNKKSIGQPLDGFGFLIPRLEKKKFLGAIWSSNLFPNRCPEDHASFSLFVGGANAQHIFDENFEQYKKEIINEFNDLMKIKEQPIFIKEKLWDKAIPQYNLGYIEHERFCDQFEKKNPGIFVSGNFRGGISVGDCIKNSDIVANKISEYIKTNLEN
ncbi:MAG: protoporphyrinogen oxidase [Melioribacteraceae bacterium]|nr:protoporphyrinogen oxidase [Melioribacteraceae bacterium]